MVIITLVGGLEHGFYFPLYMGSHPSQLTFIFFKRVKTTNQLLFCWCLVGNGWEWGNVIIIDSYCGSFPHSLRLAQVRLPSGKLT